MAIPNLISTTVLTPRVVASGQLVSGDNAFYTVPANKGLKLASFSLTNITDKSVTISVSVVPNGGTLNATARVLANYSLGAYDVISQEGELDLFKGSVFGENDVISVNVGTASAVNGLITGSVIG